MLRARLFLVVPVSEEERKIVMTVWSLFPSDTEYFDPSKAPFMINYRVENLVGFWSNSGAKALRWMNAWKNMTTADSDG